VLFPPDDMPNETDAAPISSANMVQKVLTNISFVFASLLSEGDVDLCLYELAICGGLSHFLLY